MLDLNRPVKIRLHPTVVWIVCYITLYHSVSYDNVFQYIAIYYIVLYYLILYYIILCYIVLYDTAKYWIVHTRQSVVHDVFSIIYIQYKEIEECQNLPHEQKLKPQPPKGTAATATATGTRTTVAAPPKNLQWRVATSLHKKSIIQYSKCHFLVNRVRDPFGKGSGHSHSRKQSHNHSHSSGHRRSHSHSQSRSHSNSYEKLGFPKENLCFQSKS